MIVFGSWIEEHAKKAKGIPEGLTKVHSKTPQCTIPYTNLKTEKCYLDLTFLLWINYLFTLLGKLFLNHKPNFTKY